MKKTRISRQVSPSNVGPAFFNPRPAGLGEQFSPLARPASLSCRINLERSGRLQRAFQGVEAAVKRGKTVQRALAIAHRRLHGKAFRCDRSRCFEMSLARFRGLFYAGRKSGHNAETLALKYRNPRKSSLPARDINRLLQACLSPHVRSIPDAAHHVELEYKGCCVLYRAIPRGLRAELLKLLAEKRRIDSKTKRLRKRVMKMFFPPDPEAQAS